MAEGHNVGMLTFQRICSVNIGRAFPSQEAMYLESIGFFCRHHE